jgi:hypothetical protein
MSAWNVFTQISAGNTAGRAKVYTKIGGDPKKMLGNADLYILFTSTVSQ